MDRQSKLAKSPRKGTITADLNPVSVDPFGNDYFNTLNDINDLYSDDTEEGYDRHDKLILKHHHDDDQQLQKDLSKRTRRRGSIDRGLQSRGSGYGGGGYGGSGGGGSSKDTIILEPGINNALERLRNNDPNAFNTDIIDNIYTEMAKVARIQEMDPVMKENRKRLHAANRFGITALTTEMLGQMLQTQQQILIELREDRRIRTQEEKIEGKNVVAEFVLPTDTGVIRFDFSDLESFIGPTSIKNKLQNFASKKIFAVQLVVDAGGPLYVAPNEEDFQRTYVPVTTSYEINCDKATVNWLNVRAVTDATITLIGTY